MPRIEGRALSRQSLYGREWETLEGTEGYTNDEASLFIQQCRRDDKADHGWQVTEYRYIPN